MWRSRLWLLYWVSTAIRSTPAFTRFDNAKSINRYSPPNGTAGLALSRVSGKRRLPSPPASTMPSTLGSDIRRLLQLDSLFLVEQAEVGGLAQEIFENLVALGVVGLAHVLVPRGARAEHLEHHPRVGVVLGLDQVHEHAARLLEGVLPYRLQLRLSFLEPVEPGLDGDNQEQGSILVAHEPLPSTGGPSPDVIVLPEWEPRWSFAACR